MYAAASSKVFAPVNKEHLNVVVWHLTYYFILESKESKVSLAI